MKIGISAIISNVFFLSIVCYFSIAIFMGSRADEFEEYEQILEKSLNRKRLIEIILQKNQNLEIQKLEHSIDKHNLEREWSVFEPDLVASFQRAENERENTGQQQASLSFFSGGDPTFTSEDSTYSLGIEGLLPLGTRYNIQSSLQDLQNDTNDFSSEFVSFVGVNLRQPLLQGVGVEITTTGIRIATSQVDIALQELRKAILSTIAEAEKIYWDLVAAQEEFEMRGESVIIAEKIVKDNKERVKAGKMTSLEVEQAETGLEMRKRQRGEAKLRLESAITQISYLIANSALDSSLSIIAIDEPSSISPYESDYRMIVQTAFSLNPDYLIKRKELEQEEIRFVFAKNQMKPQLDLVASYGLNGLSDGPEESFHPIGRSEFETWTLGVELRMGLGGGRKARSELEATKLRKRQKLLEMKEIEVQIANGIHNTFSRLDALNSRMESFKKEVRFNEKLLQVELTRLAEGKSDSRKVLELEEELFDVRANELSNLVNYQIAVLELELVSGTLLKNRNIDVINDETL